MLKSPIYTPSSAVVRKPYRETSHFQGQNLHQGQLMIYLFPLSPPSLSTKSLHHLSHLDLQSRLQTLLANDIPASTPAQEMEAAARSLPKQAGTAAHCTTWPLLFHYHSGSGHLSGKPRRGSSIDQGISNGILVIVLCCFCVFVCLIVSKSGLISIGVVMKM